MGKSGYLPDISSSFSFYRAYAINSLENKQWRAAAAALFNINSLLTEEYVIAVDSAEYEKQTKEAFTFECPYCKQTTPKKDIFIFERLLPAVDSILFGKKTLRSWHCINCNDDPPVEGTPVIHEKTVMPFYRKVVPEPPKAGPGLLVRFTWEPAFKKWFFSFLEQLTHQLSLYRIEYQSQHGEDMQEVGFKDPGDQF